MGGHSVAMAGSALVCAWAMAAGVALALARFAFAGRGSAAKHAAHAASRPAGGAGTGGQHAQAEPGGDRHLWIGIVRLLTQY